LGLRLRAEPAALRGARGALLHQYAPQLTAHSFEFSTAGFTAFRGTIGGLLGGTVTGVVNAINWGRAQADVRLPLTGVGIFWREDLQPCLSRGGFMDLPGHV